MKNKLRYLAIAANLILTPFLFSQHIFAQAQRNPVLEFCSGTWCQWCTCADDVILENILPNIPNAIVLAYHGDNNDPFRNFFGNNIRTLLGLTNFPTGVIDRVSGIHTWNSGWISSMNSRNVVPATVSIGIERNYNINTREFVATVDFTALENLNGKYNYNIILVEDGQVYGQTSNEQCSPGITYFPNYVHFWLVRDMMNGDRGEEIVNGAWNQGELISMNFSYTVPVPAAPAPDFNPDGCGIVVLVYKNGSPLNSNAEIQQAEQWPLTGPLSITPDENFINKSFELEQNFPNPFNPSTTIRYSIPNGAKQSQLVTLKVYDVLGNEVATLVNVEKQAGNYEVEFNAMELTSGIYFYKIQAGSLIETKKMLLLR
jgi:hypothetical protein